MYLLDTNVIAELLNCGRRGEPTRTWCVGPRASVLRACSCLSSQSSSSSWAFYALRDHRQGDMLRAWLEDRVLPAFADHVLPIDTAVAWRCAELHVPDPRNERDALIAATALVHGMTVVTRNGGDFHATGVVVIDPWID